MDEILIFNVEKPNMIQKVVFRREHVNRLRVVVVCTVKYKETVRFYVWKLSEFVQVCWQYLWVFYNICNKSLLYGTCHKQTKIRFSEKFAKTIFGTHYSHYQIGRHFHTNFCLGVIGQKVKTNLRRCRKRLNISNFVIAISI